MFTTKRHGNVTWDLFPLSHSNAGEKVWSCLTIQSPPKESIHLCQRLVLKSLVIRGKVCGTPPIFHLAPLSFEYSKVVVVWYHCSVRKEWFYLYPSGNHISLYKMTLYLYDSSENCQDHIPSMFGLNCKSLALICDKQISCLPTSISINHVNWELYSVWGKAAQLIPRK